MGREHMALKGLKAGNALDAPDWPDWVPVATRTYMAHVEEGQTIRALAKAEDVHPSTILRRVRRVECSRDDPLVDAALKRMAGPPEAPRKARADEGESALIERVLPALRRLAEPEATLAVARDLERAVVARTGPDGEPQRLAILERELVATMAVRGWIACTNPEARVQRYRITIAGRSLLKRIDDPDGFAESQTPFTGPEEGESAQRRAGQLESPLAILSRRRDGTGQPFLSRELVAAGDRLREDILLTQGESGAPPDWEAFLARLGTPAAQAARPRRGRGAQRARWRVEQALLALGPGLADVVLRTSCLHEGLEQVERRLGWSARSGKVVLRIALERLHLHYRSLEAREDCLGD